MYKKVYPGLTEEQMLDKHKENMQKAHDCIAKQFPMLKFGALIINVDGTY